MPTYHTFVKSLIVLPKGEAVFSELATTVTIEDEAAGPFVVVEQTGGTGQTGRIEINPEEWPSIYEAITSQLRICRMLESHDKEEGGLPL